VLVGGVALQLRGFSGATRDVDVTIAADELNARRLDQALEALQAQPFLTGERGVAYRTRLGPVEVTRWTDGVGDYDAWTREATMIELEPGLEVQVGSASHLLLAKEQADREKGPRRTPAHSRRVACKRCFAGGRCAWAGRIVAHRGQARPACRAGARSPTWTTSCAGPVGPWCPDDCRLSRAVEPA
jgi:hypothetical protein